MRSRVSFRVLATVGVIALAFTAGCGDNDNNDNRDGRPDPTRTPTAAVRTATPGAGPTSTPGANPTATPGAGGTTNVTIQLTASQALSGFTVDVAYPSSAGNFAADDADPNQAECTSANNNAALVKNDQEAQSRLRLVAGAAGALTFPDTITCTFNGTVTAAQLTPTVVETVDTSGATANPSALTATVSVS